MTSAKLFYEEKQHNWGTWTLNAQQACQHQPQRDWIWPQYVSLGFTLLFFFFLSFTLFCIILLLYSGKYWPRLNLALPYIHYKSYRVRKINLPHPPSFLWPSQRSPAFLGGPSSSPSQPLPSSVITNIKRYLFNCLVSQTLLSPRSLLPSFQA